MYKSIQRNGCVVFWRNPLLIYKAGKDRQMRQGMRASLSAIAPFVRVKTLRSAQRLVCARALLSIAAILCYVSPAHSAAAGSTLPDIVSIPAKCPVPAQGFVSAKNSMAVPAAVKPITRDRSCYLSMDVLKQRQTSRESIVFVDVRPDLEYQQFRILGSLNIPLSLVKAKSFLKSASVVLVNAGRATAELEQTCRELKQNGFRQVSILDGGLHAWQATQGGLAGDVFALRSLDRLTPEEIFVERRYSDWLVVDITTGTHKTLYSWLPAQRVRLKKVPNKEFINSLRTAVERPRQLGPGLKILILGDTDAEYDRLMPVVRRANLKRVFYLTGGLAGYESFINKQIAMWAHKDQPLKMPSCS